MKEEVHCASEFFGRMLESKHLPRQFAAQFRARLEELLSQRFKDHWDTANPSKGSAYRCIRINSKMDPVVSEAARRVTGLRDGAGAGAGGGIAKYLPAEFTMWIDPRDVSYRFGEDGSICSCFEAAEKTAAIATRSVSSSSEWSAASTTATTTTSPKNAHQLPPQRQRQLSHHQRIVRHLPPQRNHSSLYHHHQHSPPSTPLLYNNQYYQPTRSNSSPGTTTSTSLSPPPPTSPPSSSPPSSSPQQASQSNYYQVYRNLSSRLIQVQV